MVQPETRYARSGDVNIAYQVVGDGPLDLVVVPGSVSHVELTWQVPRYAAFYRELASHSRLIVFDKRGTGMSDRVADAPSLEVRMDDVRAVMDAAGSARAALLGVSEGAPMSMLFAATYPQRTSALVVIGPIVRRMWAPDFPWGAREEDWERAISEMERRWGNVENLKEDLRELAPSLDEENLDALATLHRYGISPGAAVALARMNKQIDVRPVLTAIRVPTLVLNHAQEPERFVQSARWAAEHIPHARHVELPGPDHVPFGEDMEAVVAEVRSFLEDSSQATEEDAPERVLTTVLFTDLVDSTTMAVELGDARWRGVVSEHLRIVRRELVRHRGRELDTSGDGFFASFDGPARAIRCACAIREAVRELGLEVRAGLHTGECELVDGKLAGVAVVTGARIAALGKPGDVLVSSTVRDLVAGSGVDFEDRGAHHLKGLPEERRVFAVASDGS